MSIADHATEQPISRPAPSSGNAVSRAAVFVATTLLVAVVLVLQSNLRESLTADIKLDPQVMLRLGLLAVCGIYGTIYLPRTLPDLLRFPMALLLLFALWNFVTAMFAINLIYAMTSSAGLLGCALAIAAVLHTLGGKRTVVTIAVSLVVWLAASWAFFLLVPQIGREPFNLDQDMVGLRLAGLSHPNGTGTFAALAMVLLMVIGVEGWAPWKWLALPMAFGGASLWASDSRTAMLALIASAAVVGLRRVRPLYWGAGLVASLLLGMAWLLAGQPGMKIGMQDFARTGEAEEISEFNGRTEVWRMVREEIKRSPLVGYGHGCQRIVIERFPLDWDPNTAHNAFLQVSLGSGWLSGLLLGSMFLWLLIRGIRRPDAFPDAVATFIFVGAMAHAGLLGAIPDSNSVVFMVALMWRSAGKAEGRAAAHHAAQEREYTMSERVHRTRITTAQDGLVTAGRISASRGGA